MYTMPRDPWPHEVYGDVKLSVQVGPTHYCDYDQEGDTYLNAEIALLQAGVLVRPESIGLPPDICKLFEPGESPVAPRVPWAMVNQIREILSAIDRIKTRQTPS